METGTWTKGGFLRANGMMNESIIGEGLMCTAEGKLTPQIEAPFGSKTSTCLSRSFYGGWVGLFRS